MNHEAAIEKTREFVERKFGGDTSGHDWWHMYRVWQLAKTIAKGEKAANGFVVELAALLHDVADAKVATTEAAGRQEIRDWLEQLKVDHDVIEQVLGAVQNIAFSSTIGVSPEDRPTLSLEAQIISDADKLDAIGAIGIARVFAYGGNKGHMLYDPNRPPETYDSAEAYHGNDPPSINHFHEKLFLLKDRLHTATAKQLAEHRHQYMEQFLAEFHAEWDGKQ